MGDIAFPRLIDYSLDLSPVRECWRQLDAALSNRYFPSLAALTIIIIIIHDVLGHISIPDVSNHF